MTGRLAFPLVTGAAIAETLRALGGLRGPRGVTPRPPLVGAPPTPSVITVPVPLDAIARRLRAASRLGATPDLPPVTPPTPPLLS